MSIAESSLVWRSRLSARRGPYTIDASARGERRPACLHSAIAAVGNNGTPVCRPTTPRAGRCLSCAGLFVAGDLDAAVARMRDGADADRRRGA